MERPEHHPQNDRKQEGVPLAQFKQFVCATHQ